MILIQDFRSRNKNKNKKLMNERKAETTFSECACVCAWYLMHVWALNVRLLAMWARTFIFQIHTRGHTYKLVCVCENVHFKKKFVRRQHRETLGRNLQLHFQLLFAFINSNAHIHKYHMSVICAHLSAWSQQRVLMPALKHFLKSNLVEMNKCR